MESLLDRITVNTQNSVRIESNIGTIYIDPLEINEASHDADYILITHDHYDHFSVDDISKLAKDDTILVVPEKMASSAKNLSIQLGNIETVLPKNQYVFAGLKLETIPAYNIIKPFHPKSAGWVGYVLEIDGKRIYIAGDTDATKEAKEVDCDIAIIPIGGTYTMDSKKAAEYINELNPEVVIPVHYGSIVGSANDATIFKNKVNPSINVAIKLAF